MQTLDYTPSSKGIRVTYQGPGRSVLTSSDSTATSNLVIDSVGEEHSGKYSCHPAEADVASVTVHIIEGMYVYILWHLNLFCCACLLLTVQSVQSTSVTHNTYRQRPHCPVPLSIDRTAVKDFFFFSPYSCSKKIKIITFSPFSGARNFLPRSFTRDNGTKDREQSCNSLSESVGTISG